MERSRLLVAASVPEGCVLAPRVSVWLAAVREVAEAHGLRDAQVATVVRVARGLCDWVDGASRTTRVVNERVAELVGCCVRTVQRWRGVWSSGACWAWWPGAGRPGGHR